MLKSLLYKILHNKNKCNNNYIKFEFSIWISMPILLSFMINNNSLELLNYFIIITSGV